MGRLNHSHYDDDDNKFNEACDSGEEAQPQKYRIENF